MTDQSLIAPVWLWYGMSLLLGLVFAPLIMRLLKHYFLDFGYGVSKTAGLLAFSYIFFLGGSLRILPFNRFLIILLLIALIWLIWVHLKGYIEFGNLGIKTWLIIAIEEIIFFLGLLFLTWIRANEPSIRGLEKFMDFGFMNSIIRSQFFPPLDMWLSASSDNPNGYPINYYYYGHLTGAFLIKLSGLSPFIGYNLVLANILAHGLVLSFSFTLNAIYLSYKKYLLPLNLKKVVAISFFAIFTALLVNLGGNLHTIYNFTNGYPPEKPTPYWQNWQTWQDIILKMSENIKINDKLNFFENLFKSINDNASYWYPNATRFIPNTIHEFPSYSYVVADLHGHVYDIPFVMLSMIFVLFVFAHIFDKPIRHNLGIWRKLTNFIEAKVVKNLNHFVRQLKFNFSSKPVTYPHLVLISIIFGFMMSIHYMTNALDGPIYFMLFSIVLLLICRSILQLIFHIILTGLSYIVFSLPFSLFFKPFVAGIGVNCGRSILERLFGQRIFTNGNLRKIGPFILEPNCQITEPWMLVVLWGFFWICGAIMLIILFTQSHFIAKIQTILKDILAYIMGDINIQDIKTKIKRLNILQSLQTSFNFIDLLFTLFFLFGTFLIIIPEFFYAKDIYPGHFRANTMFKLGYQAFIMMSMASGYVIFKVFVSKIPKIIRIALLVFLTPLVFLVLLYPFKAFDSYYSLSNKDKKITLNGAKWIEKEYPEDMEVINYLNENIKGQPVIAEAQGDSYTDYARISAYTGMPTILGWLVHEWLWRGEVKQTEITNPHPIEIVIPEYVSTRVQDIESLYNTSDMQIAKQIIQKYQVKYVIVSTLEHKKYPKLQEQKFSQLGNLIFTSTNGKARIYKISSF